MRITDRQLIDLTQYDMNSSYENMVKAQTTLSTGKQINTPGDDPIGAATALRLQSNLAQNAEFDAAASDSLGWLQTTTTSIEGVTSSLVQARTLAVQGANGTLTSDQRKAIAATIGQLLQQAVQSANGSYGGSYVLSGFKTDTPAFALSTAGGTPVVTYQGDGQAIQREVAPGQVMQVNVPGSTALPAAFAAIAQVQQNLQNGNTTALGGSDLQTIDAALDGLMVTQATVGASMNRLQAAQQTVQTNHVTLSAHLSQIVDADMAQAAVEFSTRQATYHAALSAASKVVQPSLLEFLK